MTRNVAATEARARLHPLLDEVAAGIELEITRRGHTVARIAPAGMTQALEGSMAGIATTTARDHELFTTGAFRDSAARDAEAGTSFDSSSS